MGFRSTAVIAALFCSLVLVIACSKEKLTQLVDKTKQKVTAGADQLKQGVGAAADTAREQLNLAGKAQLQLDSPLETSGCYATWIGLDDPRPGVLQVRSYSIPANESFPSFLLRAAVKAAGTSELAGQVIPATLFVQRAADGPIYHTAAGSPIQVRIVSVDDKSLAAEIVGGNLRNTHRAGEQAVTGTLSAVWQ